MDASTDHRTLDEALERCGSSWDAAQTHGLLSGRLATGGAESGFDWLRQVLEGTDERDASRSECEKLLGGLFETTCRQLAERQSEFEPLLPGDSETAAKRTTALAHWCEGFLHGLVSADLGQPLRDRLAAEPLAEIIKDVLQLTRAGPGDEQGEDETDEEAYAEIVEYLRVAAQLAYEELADLRKDQAGGEPGTDSLH